MKLRAVLAISILLITVLRVTASGAAQFDAVLEFRFLDTNGNLVAGACLFGMPIDATSSVCDNKSASDIAAPNAATDENEIAGIIRVSGQYSGGAISVEYRVSLVPTGYRVVRPTNGVFSIRPIAGLLITYVVTLEPLGSSIQGATSPIDGVCLPGDNCQGSPNSTSATVSCTVVELYPGYPGYRGVVPGLVGQSDTACLADLQAVDPSFSRDREDDTNRETARILGATGDIQDWTWETWIAIGAIRGYGDICYFCLMMDPTTVPVGPFASSPNDTRLALPLQPLVASQFSRTGDTTPNPQLLLDSMASSNWDRVWAYFLLKEALPTSSDLLNTFIQAQPGSLPDIDTLSCLVLQRGGYALVPSGVHPVDQMWIYTLGELAMGVSSGSELQRMITVSTISNEIYGWLMGDYGAVSLADYVRGSTGSYSC